MNQIGHLEIGFDRALDTSDPALTIRSSQEFSKIHVVRLPSRKMSHYIFSKTWNEITLFGRIGANKKTGKAASELFALWIPYHSAESFFSELKLVWVSLADSGNEGKLWNLSREFGYRIRTLNG